MFNPTEEIRKLAKSNYWQTLYSSSKEMSGIRIFGNEVDFTNLQIEFLNYLSFYSSLNLDIYMKEVNGGIVSKSFLREDAYMFYKSKKKDKYDSDETDSNINKSKTETKVRDSWVFSKKT